MSENTWVNEDAHGPVRALVERAMRVRDTSGDTLATHFVNILARMESIRAEADAMDARQWPQGDAAAEQLARAMRSESIRLEIFGDWGETAERHRRYWTDKAAAVLARLNAPEPDAEGE